MARCEKRLQYDSINNLFQQCWSCMGPENLVFKILLWLIICSKEMKVNNSHLTFTISSKIIPVMWTRDNYADFCFFQSIRIDWQDVFWSDFIRYLIMSVNIIMLVETASREQLVFWLTYLKLKVCLLIYLMHDLFIFFKYSLCCIFADSQVWHHHGGLTES